MGEINIIHEEYLKVVPDSKVAVLFIHGILGTPNHFSNYIKRVPENWSIYNILLKGHGKTIDDFANATMDDWKQQVEDLIKSMIDTYQDIYIVAHSMGALFAIQASINHRNKIKGIFLISPPLKPMLKPSIILNAFKMVYGTYTNDDLITIATKNAYGLEADRHFFRYSKWAPNYKALLKEIRLTNRIMPLLKTETWAFFSRKDEVVRLSTQKLFSVLPCAHTYVLNSSRHIYYDRMEYEFILDEFSEICKKHDDES